jgi:hypothetical protein
VRRLGHRTADQRPDTEFREASGSMSRQVVGEDLFGFGRDSAGLGLDEMKVPGDIEDRGNPVVPMRECRRCHPGSSVFRRSASP